MTYEVNARMTLSEGVALLKSRPPEWRYRVVNEPYSRRHNTFKRLLLPEPILLVPDLEGFVSSTYLMDP